MACVEQFFVTVLIGRHATSAILGVAGALGAREATSERYCVLSDIVIGQRHDLRRILETVVLRAISDAIAQPDSTNKCWQ